MRIYTITVLKKLPGVLSGSFLGSTQPTLERFNTVSDLETHWDQQRCWEPSYLSTDPCCSACYTAESINRETIHFHNQNKRRLSPALLLSWLTQGSQRDERVTGLRSTPLVTAKPGRREVTCQTELDGSAPSSS